MASPFGGSGSKAASIFGTRPVLLVSLSLVQIRFSLISVSTLLLCFKISCYLPGRLLCPLPLCLRSWQHGRRTCTIRTIRAGIFQISPGSSGRLVGENRRRKMAAILVQLDVRSMRCFLAFPANFFRLEFVGRMRIPRRVSSVGSLSIFIEFIRGWRNDTWERIKKWLRLRIINWMDPTASQIQRKFIISNRADETFQVSVFVQLRSTLFYWFPKRDPQFLPRV